MENSFTALKKLITGLLLMLSFTANATTYYFSAAGNDANTGTSTSAPWKTLTKFNSVFASKSPGDYFLFNRGDVFYGSMIISRSGSSGKPIIIGAYGTGANPVITGFKTVSAWTSLGSNIWESTSAASALNDMNCVVINNVNTAMGRYPNTGYLTINSHSGTTSITSTGLSGTPNWAGADLVMKIWNFAIVRNIITSQSGGTVSYKATTADAGHDGYGFFIENDARTLDAQNEWYYNPSTKKIRIYSTSAPTNVNVSTLDTLAYMVSKSYLTFDGVDFTGSNRRAFYVGSCSNVTIQNCNFNYHGLYAIWGGNNHGSASANFNFNHNTVNHVNSQGIVLQNEFSNPYIGYNTFKNCGVLAGMFKVPIAGGVWNGAYGSILAVKTNGLIVEYNSVDSTGYTGIHFTGNNTRINNNEVSRHCLQLMDGGGIYTWTGPSGSPSTGSKIYNNIVHDGLGNNAGTIEATPLCQGLYLDENTRNTEVYNNTFFNNAYGGIFSNSNTNCNFHHNTCFNNVIDQILCSSNYSSTAEREQLNTLKNNIFVAKAATQLTAKFTTALDDIANFFTTCDSNYYARPVDDNITFFTTINHGGAYGHFTLAQWQAYIVKHDIHSKKSPKTITNVNDLRIEYNATTANKTITLDGNYIDVKNVSYNGTITLAPYTSAVLIRNGAATGNKAPVANAGTDKTIALPTTTVSLSGSGTDTDGTIASYAWTKIAGPTAGVITSTTSAATTVTALAQGVYKFQLKVTDNAGATGLDTVQVTVNVAGNVPPIANAGVDKTITLPTNSVSLSGSGTDAGGSISAYLWTKIAGPAGGTITSATAATTTITAMAQGVYKFQLKVTDNGGATGLDTAQVTVNAAGGTLLPAVNPANTVNGLDYKYYQGSYTVVPTFSTLTPVKTGTTTGFNISLASRTTRFAFNFTGYISVPSDGQYTFYTNSDDGSKLYIDNVLVVTNDGVHTLTEKSGVIGLKAGKHAISVGYFQSTSSTRTLTVSYSGTGITKQAIPATSLYRVAASGLIAMSRDDQTISTTAQVGVTVYPNPFADHVVINIAGSAAGDYRLMLVDVVGRTVWVRSGNKSAGAFQQTINTSALQRGIYFLKVSQNNNDSVIKLVK